MLEPQWCLHTNNNRRCALKHDSMHSAPSPTHSLTSKLQRVTNGQWYDRLAEELMIMMTKALAGWCWRHVLGHVDCIVWRPLDICNISPSTLNIEAVADPDRAYKKFWMDICHFKATSRPPRPPQHPPRSTLAPPARAASQPS